MGENGLLGESKFLMVWGFVLVGGGLNVVVGGGVGGMLLYSGGVVEYNLMVGLGK